MKKHPRCSFIQSCGGSGKKECELPTKKCLQQSVLPQSVAAGCLNFFDSDSFRLRCTFLCCFQLNRMKTLLTAAVFAAAAYYAPTAAKLPIFKTLSTVFSGFYFFRPRKLGLFSVSHRNGRNIFHSALLCPAERPAAARRGQKIVWPQKT
ncbi:MAG: hypothetical protein ACTFAK_00530 [Candidatus Electronema sp. VV]